MSPGQSDEQLLRDKSVAWADILDSLITLDVLQPSVAYTVSQISIIKALLQSKQQEIDGILAAFTSSSSLAADYPKDESSRRKLLVRLISRFTQTLRQVSIGDYRDVLPQQQSIYRIKAAANNELTMLQGELKKTVPDLSGDIYAAKLASAMETLRGRELPGFGKFLNNYKQRGH